MPERGFVGPQSLKGTPTGLVMYVPDADNTFRSAVEHGATVLFPVQNQFYGDRSGTLKDPFGHLWTIATHIEDIPMDELHRRSEAHRNSCAQEAAKIPA